MSSKHNEWKSLKLFTVAAVTTVVIASLSKVAPVQAQAISEPTIKERLTKVRERLKQQGEQIRRESDTLSSLQNSLETEKDKILQAQWSNWNNWGNGPWNNWNNWTNRWNKWNNGWNNWRNGL